MTYPMKIANIIIASSLFATATIAATPDNTDNLSLMRQVRAHRRALTTILQDNLLQTA